MELKAVKRSGSEKEFTEVLGNVYGHNKDNISIKFVYSEFEKIYKEAGTSSIIDLDIDGEKHQVIIKDIQIDPVKDRIHHVDFYEFTRGEEMEATISLNFIGEAPAEKKGFSVNTAKTEIEVRALPKDLVAEIDVDLSVLEDGGSVIRLADIKLPEGIKLVNDPEEAVVSVVASKEVGEEDSNEEPDLSTEEGRTEEQVEEKE